MDKQKQLDKLREKMLKDMSLPLRSGATNLVFGEGNPDTQVLFIGEGPGYWEDQKARPFVGNAGALLNRLLLSINLPREDVYITNVVHFRPPENRDPETSEIKAFQPYLDGIIKIIEPKIICTLGRFSMAKFLPGVTISNVHGKPRKVTWGNRQLWVVPMYHPAAALRSTEIKTRIFNDFKKIIDVLENSDEDTQVESKPQVEQMKLV